MLSHGNLLANAQHNLAATGHRAGQRWLHVCPMFHVAGIANLLACTWAGAEQVLLPRFDAAAVLETIERERITHTVLVPTMLAMLLDAPGADDADLSSLRHVQYAASPISAELQRRVLERLPDCDVAQFYGMTEAAPTVTHLSRPRTTAAAAAGSPRWASPVPGVEVEVARRSASCGSAGRTSCSATGTARTRPPRRSSTAGTAPATSSRTDDDGYLYLVDRAKDMIITGGENVYSLEVEAVLLRHPAVAEAAVFGVPDDRWGEAVHAVVVPREPVTADALLEHCRAAIAGFKVPREIELRDEPLPKSGPGKVLKTRLREPFWEGRERRVDYYQRSVEHWRMWSRGAARSAPARRRRRSEPLAWSTCSATRRPAGGAAPQHVAPARDPGGSAGGGGGPHQPVSDPARRRDPRSRAVLRRGGRGAPAPHRGGRARASTPSCRSTPSARSRRRARPTPHPEPAAARCTASRSRSRTTSRPPASRWRSARRSAPASSRTTDATVVARTAGGRRDPARQDELPAVRRRDRDRQPGLRAHEQPVRPRAHARRQQRRRGGGRSPPAARPAASAPTRARASACPPTSAASPRSSRPPAACRSPA